MKKIIALLLTAVLALCVCVCGFADENVSADLQLAPAAEAGATDYSDPYNWLICDYDNADKKDTQADVIFFYGTCVTEPYYDDGSTQISDAMKTAVSGMYVGSTDAFDDGTRMYIPCYRQIALAPALQNEKHSDFINQIKASLAAQDLYDALDYYFQNYNEGRPFILAGYSQGGACTQVVLEEYFGREENREYLDRMVATYSIAYGVDKKLIEDNDYLKFATGATDTGVIVSWNTEGPGDKGYSFLLADNPADTLVINPINWKTDDTPAMAEESLGSYVDGELVTPGVYNLQYDPERGSLICDNNTNYVSMGDMTIWGGKSLHLYEISQAYADVRQNMHDRIDTYLAKEKVKMATEYTKAENWAVFENNGTEEVDTVFFCPSLVFSSVTGTGTGLPEEMLTGIDTVLKGQAAVFEDSTNVYVPLYRQQVFNAEVLSQMDMSDPVHWMFEYYRTHVAYEDCTAALDYYFENCNNGKPFILAGHSQGSILVHLILEKYMSEHPEYYERMVAAYAIGMSTPKDYMEANPHLKYATGADDTGVIISYNTEGPDAEGTNFLLCEGSYLINPVNWKTDDTYAPAEDNLGSYVDGEIVMNFADAQIDFDRYAIVSNADCSYGSMAAYTGTKCLHGSDYQIYMNNLKENVKVRIDAFMAK